MLQSKNHKAVKCPAGRRGGGLMPRFGGGGGGDG